MEQDALHFLKDMGILPGTAATVTQVIVDRHATGKFTSVRQCWASLRFLKDNVQAYLDGPVSATAQTREEKLLLLKSSLLVPSHEGSLVSIGKLSVRGFMGVECPCVAEGRPTHEYHLLDRGFCHFLSWPQIYHTF